MRATEAKPATRLLRDDGRVELRGAKGERRGAGTNARARLRRREGRRGWMTGR